VAKLPDHRAVLGALVLFRTQAISATAFGVAVVTLPFCES